MILIIQKNDMFRNILFDNQNPLKKLQTQQLKILLVLNLKSYQTLKKS